MNRRCFYPHFDQITMFKVCKIDFTTQKSILFYSILHFLIITIVKNVVFFQNRILFLKRRLSATCTICFCGNFLVKYTTKKYHSPLIAINQIPLKKISAKKTLETRIASCCARSTKVQTIINTQFFFQFAHFLSVGW